MDETLPGAEPWIACPGALAAAIWPDTDGDLSTAGRDRHGGADGHGNEADGRGSETGHATATGDPAGGIQAKRCGGRAEPLRSSLHGVSPHRELPTPSHPH